MNGNNALEALSPNGHFKVFYPENNGREGLFMNIQALSVATFGNEPWALRVVSAIFGILTVLGVYFFTRELFSDNKKQEAIALLSAFFIATSFWHINFSRIGFRAIMAPFFAVWAFYFLLLALNKIQSLNSKSYILYSILGGVFLGLGFHSYIAFRAMPALAIIIWILYWLKNKDKVFRKKIVISAILFIIASLIMFAPLGRYFLKNPKDFMGRTTQVSIMSSGAPLKNLTVNILKTAGMFFYGGDGNWRHNYAGRPELFWPVGILLLVGTILGLRMFFKKASPPFIILFGWLAISALPVIISNEGIPHALRSILLIPPAIILAGFGGVWLYEKISAKIRHYSGAQKLIVNTALILILFLFVFEAYDTYFIKWGQNPNVQGAFAADYVQMGRELNALPKELPKYVIVEAGGVNVRGIPMPAQTVMFLTDTFTPEKQKEKNLFYVLPITSSYSKTGAYITVLK
jgi:4-amino-4-deoxy-L-arabinose transferase-like glycosyltransferase